MGPGFHYGAVSSLEIRGEGAQLGVATSQIKLNILCYNFSKTGGTGQGIYFVICLIALGGL